MEVQTNLSHPLLGDLNALFGCFRTISWTFRALLPGGPRWHDIFGASKGRKSLGTRNCAHCLIWVGALRDYFWAVPRVVWKKAPRAMRATRGNTFETVLPSNESCESKTGCNRTPATVLSVPLTLEAQQQYFSYRAITCSDGIAKLFDNSFYGALHNYPFMLQDGVSHVPVKLSAKGVYRSILGECQPLCKGIA